MKNALNMFQKNALIMILILTIVSMLGSLYFSDIKGYAPCVLCWYQRICMYSLVPILFVGLLRGDKKVYHYIFPLALIGWLFALYHNLLYVGIIDAGESCSYGISCTAKYVDYLGFITIPLMAFTSFTLILVLSMIYRRWLKLSAVQK